MSLPIRYSPSGTIIGNANGGEAVPGVGFQLRLVDAQASAGALVLSGTLQTIPKSGPEDFVVGMSSPKPNLRYHASLICGVANDADGFGVQVGAAWRVDSGLWNSIPSGNLMTYACSLAGTATYGHLIVYQSLLTLGSSLPSPVLGASSLLEVKFEAKGAGGSLSANTLHAQLIETL